MHYLGWVHLIFGLWLLYAPSTFGYHNAAMTWSSWISGAATILLGGLSIRRPHFLWGVAAIGLWLQLAPLIFWAPDAASYLNDTAIGALMLVFSLVISGTPGVVESHGSEVPPGWSYNPSSHFQRVPVIGLNFLCWFTARYLAAYQLGYIDAVWDPFFGDGTEKVLTSTISKMFPVPDAGLGAVAYTFEALTGFGSTRRWHTTPWLVLFFGFLAVPVSCVSIVLIILQPTVVGHFCTLCIAIAILMLAVIPLSVDEVVAVGQFLYRSVKEGKPFWKTVFLGSALAPGQADPRSASFTDPFPKMAKTMFLGNSLPWNLLATTALGIAGMFLGDFIPAALIIVFSVIAFAEVTRASRWLCIPLGLWLAFSHPPIGIATMVLSIRKGPIREKYATWNRWIV